MEGVSDMMNDMFDGIEEAEMHIAAAAVAVRGSWSMLCGCDADGAVVEDDVLRYGYTHFLKGWRDVVVNSASVCRRVSAILLLLGSEIVDLCWIDVKGEL